MKTETPDYVSFLVRMWRDPATAEDASQSGANWLVQIEHIPGGEIEYFASLDQLFAFIRAQLCPTGPSAAPEEKQCERKRQ